MPLTLSLLLLLLLLPVQQLPLHFLRAGKRRLRVGASGHGCPRLIQAGVRAYLEAGRRVGVPGCEGPSTRWTHFQAGQRAYLVQYGGVVDVPGCEGLQG